MVLVNRQALAFYADLGEADLRYIVEMASDGIDPATVTYSEVIYKLVRDLRNVILIIEHNRQRLFSKGPRPVNVKA
jgi:hypothetical protein